MALDFLVEIIKSYPTFSSRVSSDEQTVFIFPSIETEVVLSGSHRDRSYSSRIDRCKELDCSEFYTSAVAAGAVSLCGECEEQVVPPTGPPLTCKEWNAIGNYLLNPSFYDTPTGKKLGRVYSGDGYISYDEYLAWLNTNDGKQQLRSFLSKSGYWLGLPPCVGGQFQCIVECGDGGVNPQTGEANIPYQCWNTSTYGGGRFGDVYTDETFRYQIYDPIQMILAGVTPRGGSFGLLNYNPLNGRLRRLTAEAGGRPECSSPHTILSDARSCLVSNAPKSCEDGDYEPDETQQERWKDKAIRGDYGGKSLLSNGECFLTPTTSVIENSFALSGALGQNLDFGEYGDSELQINEVLENCAACMQKLQEDDEGPSCCQVSTGEVTIRGAPIWQDGIGWVRNGETSDFWDYFKRSGDGGEDDFLKDDGLGNSKWKNGCEDPQNGERANGIGVIPCSSTDPEGCLTPSKEVIGMRIWITSPDGFTTVLAGKQPIFKDGACDGSCSGTISSFLTVTCPYSSDPQNPFENIHFNSRPDSNKGGCNPPPSNLCQTSSIILGSPIEPICCSSTGNKDNSNTETSPIIANDGEDPIINNDSWWLENASCSTQFWPTPGA